jgi:hypothetical protein
MAWCMAECSPVDREYGLVPSNFAELGLAGAQRRLFKLKWNEVLAMTQRIEMARMEASRGKH